ncbi:MAG: efflux RND transporter periplasmic adaptor subunit [Phycisphaeraceae bacterium]
MTEHQPTSSSPTPSAPPPPSAKPPRGPALWIILIALIVLVLIFWLGAVTGPYVYRVTAQAWHRTVHGGEHDDAQAGATQYYTCGMHPWVILPKPGDCPICGMKLVPLDPAKFTGDVAINPVIAQNIGIRVAPVTTGAVTRSLRTVGTVTYDETRVRDVNIKVDGWIEKLHVDYLGAPVKKGQPLFELYSPELYAAQQEYLLAWRNRQGVGGDSLPEAARAGQQLLTSARIKLEYFDITREQIDELERRGQPAKTMTIASPHDGIVTDKMAFQGMKVDPGMRAYRIADLSKVWVMVTLYEYQLPFVQVGQSAVMSLSYVPGQEFEGKVIYLYPYVNEKTRQVDMRLEFDNSQGLLKPGMYATVDLHSTLAQDRTLAPRSAVIDTGQRQVAFVSLGEGRFEPRDVRLGVQAQDGLVEVLRGLKPGEQVVTSGQFLLDSEANAREALAKMIKGDLAAEQPTTVAAAEAGATVSLPQQAATLLSAIIKDYVAIQDALAGDTLAGIDAPARRIAQQVDALLKIDLPDDPHFWHQHEEVATVRGKALELASTKDLEQARLALADLSVALSTLLRGTGVPASYGQELQELHCPMYRQGQGGTIWLQPAGKVRNPYFGAVMLGCFDKRVALPVAGQARNTD